MLPKVVGMFVLFVTTNGASRVERHAVRLDGHRDVLDEGTSTGHDRQGELGPRCAINKNWPVGST